jgi:3D (Asp-Asp-Asp) domain-containing protein
MKTTYFSPLRRYTTLAIILVILIIVLTPLARHREIIPLAAETSTPSSIPDYTASLHPIEQIAPEPSTVHPTQQISPGPSAVQLPQPAINQHRLMRVTAYCPCQKCCGARAAGITASGHKITPGDRFVAAPPELHFGTTIHVPGYNRNSSVKVLDRGGAIQDNHLDVFFRNHKTAIKWGVRYLTVTIETHDPAFAGQP